MPGNMPFRWPLRVYIEDTDAGGIVFYANYLRFMERARSEWLRGFGYDQETLRQSDILFVVTEVNIRYRQPARLDDELMATVSIQRLRKASMIISQQLLRGSDVLTDAQVTIACTDTAGKPRSIPPQLFDAVNATLAAANTEE
ncbi:tol-pal system-associated acyl-CoA thioesterase [Thalassolituus marinus]|uniref:Tol-pal system-associated acyl-CoA thioesterase n=2 Tax=Thalassolituus marinus TaxID=671053 RepID=A0ABS7ZPK0_9GAMM|nr:tol-pal system-associated acyl-CoA thioesterase [Thalassolituus marinus]